MALLNGGFITSEVLIGQCIRELQAIEIFEGVVDELNAALSARDWGKASDILIIALGQIEEKNC